MIGERIPDKKMLYERHKARLKRIARAEKKEAKLRNAKHGPANPRDKPTYYALPNGVKAKQGQYSRMKSAQWRLHNNWYEMPSKERRARYQIGLEFRQ